MTIESRIEKLEAIIKNLDLQIPTSPHPLTKKGRRWYDKHPEFKAFLVVLFNYRNKKNNDFLLLKINELFVNLNLFWMVQKWFSQIREAPLSGPISKEYIIIYMKNFSSYNKIIEDFLFNNKEFPVELIGFNKVEIPKDIMKPIWRTLPNGDIEFTTILKYGSREHAEFISKLNPF